MRLAASAVAVLRARPNSTSATAVPTVPAATSRSGPSRAFSHGSGRRRDRAGPDRAEQQAVELGTGRDLVARDERQQRPIGAGEQEESDGADQRRAQMRIVAGVAQSGAHGAAEPLGRQMARARSAASATTSAPPMTPRLLIALIQNGAAIPSAAVMAPPSAGPTARLMLKPTLLTRDRRLQVLPRHELRRRSTARPAPSARRWRRSGR